MTSDRVVVLGCVALVVSAALGPLALWLLRRRGLLDRPNARSSHEVPTPRGGGTAPAIACLVAVGLASSLGSSDRAVLACTAAALGILGFVDDVRGVPALRRLAIQCATVVVAAVWLLDGVEGSTSWRLVVGAGLVLWVVGYVNAFNFMDGINGIATVQVVVAGLAWHVVGRIEDVPALTVGGTVAAAAALGFLPFNFPRARMFLGDVGSYFLGGWLAVVAFLGVREGVALEAVVAPLGVFLVDTATTLVQRVRRGERWYEAHRDHVYQRLTRLGWSHATTATAVGAVMMVCSLLGMASLGDVPLRLVADVAGVALLAGYVLSPAALTRTPVGA